jgi:hypothetical protein
MNHERPSSVGSSCSWPTIRGGGGYGFIAIAGNDSRERDGRPGCQPWLSSSGSDTMNSLPQPSPALLASTLP